MNKGQLIFGLIDFIIVINYTENITEIRTYLEGYQVKD